jgi:gliding motility-associated-like protein
MLYIKQGNTKVIEPVVTGSAIEYSWSPGLYLSSAAVKTPTVKGVESQLYTLTVTGTAGCAVSKQIQINVLKPIVVPNTFTPNADGVNDVWVINELANYPGAEVSVYNRYGMKMFFSRGYGVPWDGTYQGKPVPFGTYYYVISLGIYGAPMSGYVAVVR